MSSTMSTLRMPNHTWSPSTSPTRPIRMSTTPKICANRLSTMSGEPPVRVAYVSRRKVYVLGHLVDAPLPTLIHPSAQRDCMKTPDRCRIGSPPGTENGPTGLYFGISCYRRPTIGASPTTFHTVSERLYEKSSNTGKPPRHEADHGSVHQRLPARTQTLVVFAHPPVLVDPSDRPLHHPPSRQNQEAFRGHQFLPIRLDALFGPFPGPRHQHLFGSGLFRTLDELHAPTQRLFDPVLALVLSSVARVQPQVGEARKSFLRSMQ